MTVLLFTTGFLCLAVGATAVVTRRVLPWLVGRVSRPRLWGAGYSLFGAVVLYHAVVEVLPVRPGPGMVLAVAGAVTGLCGLGMTVAAQSARGGTRFVRKGRDAAE